MKYSIPPGVFDIIPQDLQEPWKNSSLWDSVEKTVRELVALYGFHEIRTPLFEKTELFQRSVGEGSDIVSKEMYSFQDRGGRNLSLRPEGTAPVIRALIENRLDQKSQVQKFFYIAPMFRYERSQAGRYRQHHQFGVEIIGASQPAQDAEAIDLLYTLYKKLGLQNLTLYINSIGSTEARSLFKEALKNYLIPLQSSLSPESQVRLSINPLRILDSKDPVDKEIVSSAPSILDFLTPDDQAHFASLKELLHTLNIPFQVNRFLVRGLDYYNKTVFEITAGELGAQNSIGGGGRYDGLIETLGGKNLPAFGFGTGIERILQTMLHQKVVLPPVPHPLVYLIPMGSKAFSICFSLLHQLREEGLSAEMDFSGKKLGKSIQAADELRSTYCIILGDTEIENQTIELKELATGHKTPCSLSNLIHFLKQSQ